MKKLFLLSSFVLLNIIFAEAQMCTPTWTGSGTGINPDSAQNLQAATVAIPYAETINFKIPSDTVISNIKFPIDSFVLTEVTGLPSTITYACNPSNCSFPGGSTDCVQLSGTPVIGDTGIHHLKVVVVGHSGSVYLPDTIKYYFIKVSTTAGIANLNQHFFDVAQNYPNPVKATTEIDYNLPITGNVNFKVYNLLGNILFQKDYFSKSGNSYITYDASVLPDGMYFYTLSDGNTTITHRMIVNK